MEFIQAIVESYDQANHRANVRPLSNPGSLLVAVPVASHCPGELIGVDERVLVVSWPDAGAVIIGPYESRPVYPVHGYMTSATEETFTSTGYVMWPGTQLSLTLLVKSRLWVHCSFVIRKYAVAAWGCYFRIYVNGGATTPQGGTACSVIYHWYSCALSGVVPVALNPGTHTVDVRVARYATGTVRGRHISFGVQAFPCA